MRWLTTPVLWLLAGVLVARLGRQVRRCQLNANGLSPKVIHFLPFKKTLLFPSLICPQFGGQEARGVVQGVRRQGQREALRRGLLRRM